MYFSLVFGYFIQLDIQLKTGWVGGGGGLLNNKAQNLLREVC